MKNFLKLALVVSLVFSGSSVSLADRCITQGDQLNLTHSLYSESVDPYSHLLPSDLKGSESLSVTYDLKLKPLVVNDLTKLQFQTYDSRSPAAGYTSPYLWDVGQGPGYRNPMSSPYSPYGPPMPVRR